VVHSPHIIYCCIYHSNTWFKTSKKISKFLLSFVIQVSQYLFEENIRIIIYLETKCCPNRRIFVFWRPFWIQNGRHSKPKYSPYGAAWLANIYSRKT
jgi:hypothetical protein